MRQAVEPLYMPNAPGAARLPGRRRQCRHLGALAHSRGLPTGGACWWGQRVPLRHEPGTSGLKKEHWLFRVRSWGAAAEEHGRSSSALQQGEGGGGDSST